MDVITNPSESFQLIGGKRDPWWYTVSEVSIIWDAMTLMGNVTRPEFVWNRTDTISFGPLWQVA